MSGSQFAIVEQNLKIKGVNDVYYDLLNSNENCALNCGGGLGCFTSV